MIGLSRRELLSGAATLTALRGISVAWPAHASERPALPIPPELRADAKGEIALRAQPGQRQFLPGPSTATYGINGPFLGPAIRVRRGDKVAMKVTGSRKTSPCIGMGSRFPAMRTAVPIT